MLSQSLQNIWGRFHLKWRSYDNTEVIKIEFENLLFRYRQNYNLATVNFDCYGPKIGDEELSAFIPQIPHSSKFSWDKTQLYLHMYAGKYPRRSISINLIMDNVRLDEKVVRTIGLRKNKISLYWTASLTAV